MKKLTPEPYRTVAVFFALNRIIFPSDPAITTPEKSDYKNARKLLFFLADQGFEIKKAKGK